MYTLERLHEDIVRNLLWQLSDQYNEPIVSCNTIDVLNAENNSLLTISTFQIWYKYIGFEVSYDLVPVIHELNLTVASTEAYNNWVLTKTQEIAVQIKNLAHKNESKVSDTQ